MATARVKTDGTSLRCGSRRQLLSGLNPMDHRQVQAHRVALACCCKLDDLVCQNLSYEVIPVGKLKRLTDHIEGQ